MELHPQQTDTLEEIKEKKFAKPFRIVMKRVADQTVVWFEVESLLGLRKICDMVAAGNLIPVDHFATLDRQLWGHLAEHVGFLRAGPDDDMFSAGLQPLGAPFSKLASDLSTIMGVENATECLVALSEISEISSNISKAPSYWMGGSKSADSSAGTGPKCVDENGILTQSGEAVASQLVASSESAPPEPDATTSDDASVSDAS
jgi:hypothetical protein